MIGVPIILESPYAGNIHRNLTYLNRCLRHCLLQGEAPFASHRMYTEALWDSVPAERELGITAGYVWWEFAEYIVFYTDYKWSDGMNKALDRAKYDNKTFYCRQIGPNP